MDILRQMGLAAILSLLLSFTPLVMAVAYVLRPSERRLALMRPLSQVGLFAALAGTAIGLINSLVYLSRRGFDPESMRIGVVHAMAIPPVSVATLSSNYSRCRGATQCLCTCNRQRANRPG